MRNVGLLLSTLALLITLAAASSNIFSPFYEPLLHSFLGTSNSTASQELRRRQQQGSCPSGYGNNCAGLGDAALCCPDNAVCSADYAGNVACCPVGAACTGSVSTTATTTTSTPGTTSTTTTQSSATQTTSTQSFIFATTAATTEPPATTTVAGGGQGETTATAPGGGVIISPGGGSDDGGAGGSTGAASSLTSTVPNPYYPMTIVSSTYASADACSSAISSCQSDAARCVAVLAGGVATGGVDASDNNSGGITIDAPGGGTTIVPAVPTSLPAAQASSVCASLRSRVCNTARGLGVVMGRRARRVKVEPQVPGGESGICMVMVAVVMIAA